MTERERQVPRSPDARRTRGAPGGDGLAEIRARGERMLDVSDAIIGRGLSTDSGAFVRSDRQTGGQ